MKGIRSNRYWYLLPLTFRLSICAALLFISLGLVAIPFVWLLIGVIAFIVAMSLLGAISLHKMHLAYLAILLWAGLVGSLAFSVRPHHTFSGFLGTVPYVLVFFLFALMVIQAIKLSEWLFITHHLPRVIEVALIGVAAASASIETAVRKCIEALEITRSDAWFGLRRGWIWRRCDQLETSYVVSLTMKDVLWESLQSWNRPRRSIPESALRNSPLRLDEIYGINDFAKIFEAVFSIKPICAEWTKVVSNYFIAGSFVADIGAGAGRMSLYLAKQGIRVLAFEKDPILCRRLNEIAKHNGGAISVIDSIFPKSSVDGCCDGVILHQNVMLELINEMGIDDTWASINAILKQDGIVIYDYLEYLVPPDIGKWITLVDDNVPSVGKVQYRYKLTGRQNNNYQIVIDINETAIDNRTYTERRDMTVVVPEWQAVIEGGNRQGFSLENVQKSSMGTFFPGSMGIVVMSKQKGE